ncbi:hypothetical protein Droror1_Dr00002773 [Drosera rotundifolia]
MKPSISTCCCFFSTNDSSSSSSGAVHYHSRLIRSASTWIKSTTTPDIKDKCFHLFSRRRCRRRCNASAGEFRYDPLSYALNFEDEDDERMDEFPLQGFSARLPPSPPRGEEKELYGTAKVIAV